MDSNIESCPGSQGTITGTLHLVQQCTYVVPHIIFLYTCIIIIDLHIAIILYNLNCGKLAYSNLYKCSLVPDLPRLRAFHTASDKSLGRPGYMYEANYYCACSSYVQLPLMEDDKPTCTYQALVLCTHTDR